MTTPRRNAVDLHTHSTRSDGVLEPAALFAAMRDHGLQIAALSDHDTLDGYRELRAAGLGHGRDGPLLVPAVEINTVVEGTELESEALGGIGEIHILGYGVDADDDRFEQVLTAQRELRRTRFQAGVERLREIDMPIDDVVPQVTASGASSLGRPHLAQALVLKGYATSVQDAFANIVGRGCPGYVPKIGLGPRATLDAIRGAGGLASLAHFPDAVERRAVLDRLVEWGLGGLEVYYGGSGHGFEPQRVRALATLAAELGLVATGGSDYHGHPMDDGRPVSYADAQGLTYVPEEIGEAFLAALERAELFTR